MNVEQLILWHLQTCSNNWANAKRHVIVDLCRQEGISQEEAGCQAEQTLQDLVLNKKIKLIPFEKMTDNQKFIFEKDPCCVFYEIL